MFELLFRYPPQLYARGRVVFLAAWPPTLLLLLVLAAAAGLGFLLRRRGRHLPPARAAAIWGLQSLVVALILLLLWQPALSLSQLKPEQNIVAVLLDDSRSMALPAPGAASREAAAVATLQQRGLLERIDRRFQTRIYTLDATLHRLADPARALGQLQPTGSATRLGDSLDQLLAQTADLPLGGIVVLSDGSDNAGGISLATMNALQRRQIPVQTIGFGDPTPLRDVEMDDLQMPARAMAMAREPAVVRFHQHGFAGQAATLSLRAGPQLLASQTVRFGPADAIQTATLMFNAGAAGPKSLTATLSPLAGEASAANNALTRLLDVVQAPHRILYMEGEPRWTYKFIRRAVATDPEVQLVSMVRATENKIYRQGLSDPSELAGGFPSTPEEMFRYQGLIIGSVEAAYFTPVQQNLIQAFAERRGGGVLFLGGQYALADGGWGDSPLAAMLPVILPGHKATFVRGGSGDPIHATALLAPAGYDSLITRLVDDPAANQQKWQHLPWLMDYQDAGTPKPGAAVLAQVLAPPPDGRRLPLLTTEAYGRGRTAVWATSGDWRWQMLLPITDPSYGLFWQQLLHWLVEGTPGPVTASAPTLLQDNGHVHLTAAVRDPAYNPDANAQVTAHILGPGGLAADVALQPAPDAPGDFAADYDATLPGVYVAQVAATGPGLNHASDTVAFQRQDGVAENFHTAPDFGLLRRLAQQTGGQLWRADQTAALAGALPYAAAGVTEKTNLPLWNLPIAFVLLIALPLLEWFLRRRWGLV